MEWLSSLLGLGGGQTAPFGSLAGGAGGAGGGGTLPAAAPQMMGAGMQLPGIFGKFLNQGAGNPGPYSGYSGALGSMGANINPQSGQISMQPGAGGGQPNNQFAMNQAMNLLKPQPIQAPPMMKLLSGPGAGQGM